MHRSKQLLVSFVTAPLLILAATTGMAAPNDFSQCDVLKGTGAGYGLCRAGVAVGCADDTGNAQACTNIEEHFLAVTGQNPPWLVPNDACPCDFDAVSMDSPPWADESNAFTCMIASAFNVFMFDEDTAVTRLDTGLLDGTSLSCRIIVDGNVLQEELLNIDQNTACKSKLFLYWNDLQTQPYSEEPGFNQTNECSA